MTMMAEKSENRRIYIDFIKIIAIFMVLFNHTNTNGFVLFTVSRTSALYPLYLFIAIFIKVAVPLFFMSSGALLLNKEESLRVLFKKRFLKFLIVLFFASVIAYLYNCLRLKPQKLSVLYFFKQLYSSRLNVALWYLYAYLAFILMLPFLRKLAKNMSNREYLLMFVLYGLFRCLAIFEFLVWKGTITHNKDFFLFIITDYIFYPLMGYYIEYRTQEKDINGKRLFGMLITSFFSIVICSVMTHYRCMWLKEWKESTCQTYFTTLIFLPTITVFCGAKYVFLRFKHSVRLQKILTNVSSTTFGIYLIEQICRTETKPIFDFLKPYIHTLPACLIWIFCACLFGGCITFLVKKIPIIKDYI